VLKNPKIKIKCDGDWRVQGWHVDLIKFLVERILNKFGAAASAQAGWKKKKGSFSQGHWRVEISQSPS